jgi:hypothetical protein
MYGGIIAGVVLILTAVVVVIPPLVRTQHHAKAIVPDALIAKFQKAQDDLDRVQGSSVVLEELTVRAREAIDRIREAAEVLGSLRVVPTPNRD